eukprot:UN33109
MLKFLNRKDDDDQAFLLSLEKCKLDTLDHYNRLRAIWLYLKKYGRKRGKNDIFKYFQQFEKKKYHDTKTYFWIQMVHYTCAAQINP